MTKKREYRLSIGWLYPDLMSTYGDRGNVMILTKRCRWRGIDVDVAGVSLGTDGAGIDSADLLFMGGAQDRQQEIVKKDLIGGKEINLRRVIERGIPGLFVCGAYQFLGSVLYCGRRDDDRGIGNL